MDIYGVYTEVLIRWMERIAAGEPPLIFGDGNQTMDFVYIEDIARANILAAKADVTDVAFNIASGKETSLNQLADMLLGVMGSNLRPEYQPERKVNPVQRRLADTEAASQMLNFKAITPLEKGLERLVQWWQSQ
jgi:UDP-glucose 4-epimerase